MLALTSRSPRPTSVRPLTVSGLALLVSEAHDSTRSCHQNGKDYVGTTEILEIHDSRPPYGFWWTMFKNCQNPNRPLFGYCGQWTWDFAEDLLGGKADKCDDINIWTVIIGGPNSAIQNCVRVCFLDVNGNRVCYYLDDGQVGGSGGVFSQKYCESLGMYQTGFTWDSTSPWIRSITSVVWGSNMASSATEEAQSLKMPELSVGHFLKTAYTRNRSWPNARVDNVLGLDPMDDNAHPRDLDHSVDGGGSLKTRTVGMAFGFVPFARDPRNRRPGDAVHEFRERRRVPYQRTSSGVMR